MPAADVALHIVDWRFNWKQDANGRIPSNGVIDRTTGIWYNVKKAVSRQVSF